MLAYLQVGDHRKEIRGCEFLTMGPEDLLQDAGQPSLLQMAFICL